MLVYAVFYKFNSSIGTRHKSLITFRISLVSHEKCSCCFEQRMLLVARVQRTEQAYVPKIGLYIPDYDTAHSDPCSDCKC